MRAILMSIRPEHLVKILNGEKTIEIRKSFPKGFKGWVYIYCTLGNLNKYRLIDFDKFAYVKPENRFHYVNLDKSSPLMNFKPFINGKVVARFWLDGYDTYRYGKGKTLYGLHIENPEIFDKPKELSEFSVKKAPHIEVIE